MESVNSKYGILSGAVICDYYDDNSLKACVLKEKNILSTKYGDLVPEFEFIDARIKDTYSVSFYQDGSLEKVSLSKQTIIPTSIGNIPAELITFYQNGNIMRLFPLNGQLSAYWSEADEFTLAKKLEFDLKFNKIQTIITNISFYEDSKLKSIALWSGEKLNLNTPLGVQSVRQGISIHPNGSLKSFEPLNPLLVETSIGTIEAFDYSDKFLFKDDKSITFDQNQKLKSINTSSNKITVIDKKNNLATSFSPDINKTILDNDDFIKPLHIIFEDEFVIFNKNAKFKISDCNFEIETIKKIPKNIKDVPLNCGTCNIGAITFFSM